MRKYWSPILFIALPGIVLLAILILLANTRISVPVHIKATLTYVEVAFAEPESLGGEWSLLEKVNVESIRFLDCQELELIGNFSDPETFQSFEGINGLRLAPRSDSAYITLTGSSLRLEELIVEPGAMVFVDPSRNIQITITKRSARSSFTMDSAVEVEWQDCDVEIEGQELRAKSNRLRFYPDEAFDWLTVSSRPGQGLRELKLKLELGLPEDVICEFEAELPVTELSFVRSPFAAVKPELTTTIQGVEITFPTLPNEKPVVLPAGSYLRIGNLRDFTLKQVSVNPGAAFIETTLYGYTNDLRAAYGKGRLTQLLPSSLILLRQKASLLAIIGIMLWFWKNVTDVYERLRSWRKEGEDVSKKS